jgi:hypothetical protein
MVTIFPNTIHMRADHLMTMMVAKMVGRRIFWLTIRWSADHLLFCFVPCHYFQELKQAECDGAQAFRTHEKTVVQVPDGHYDQLF